MRRGAKRRLGLLAALVAAMAAGSSAASAATVAEARSDVQVVRPAIEASEQLGDITTQQAAGYRQSLRSTLAVLQVLGGAKQARRDELASQLTELAEIARGGNLTAARMPALFHQLAANRIWFSSRPPPASLARVQVAGDPIIYGYYPGHGLQIQPLFNWTQANTYYFAHRYDDLQALIDALAPLAVEQPGGWIAWEYDFDYGSGRAPWLSGMPQGVALQVLARAWQATGNQRDLALAQQVLPGLGIPRTSSGLLDESLGEWWPLYEFEPAEHVLNGDMQVVISLYDYAALTGDPTALAWAQQGSATVLAQLPTFDTGAWSMYDQHHEAPLNYHDLMTTQLGQLAKKTGSALFASYASRFAAYRHTPPTFTSASATATPATFYPAPRDGFEDAVTFTGTLDKVSSSVGMTVTDQGGAVVASAALGGRSHGPVTVTWDGLAHGRPAPAGLYTVSLSATDLAGNRSLRTPIGQAMAVRDTTPPQILLLRVARVPGNFLRLTWNLRDDASPTASFVIHVGKQTATLTDVPLRGRQTLLLKLPKHRFTAWIRVTDTSGNADVVRRQPG